MSNKATENNSFRTEKESPKIAKGRKILCLSLSTKEQVLLVKKMKEEGWGNTGRFIKKNLFGNDIEEIYQTVLSETDKEGMLDIMKVLLENFSDELIYTNYKMREVFEFYEQKKDNSQKDLNVFRKVGIWKSSLEKKIDNLHRDVRLLLHHYDIDIKGHEGDKVRGVPQKIINEKLKNWGDNQSPEIIEQARRVQNKEE